VSRRALPFEPKSSGLALICEPLRAADGSDAVVRIEPKKSTGQPVCQFVVYPENELERLVVEAFLGHVSLDSK